MGIDKYLLDFSNAIKGVKADIINYLVQEAHDQADRFSKRGRRDYFLSDLKTKAMESMTHQHSQRRSDAQTSKVLYTRTYLPHCPAGQQQGSLFC